MCDIYETFSVVDASSPSDNHPTARRNPQTSGSRSFAKHSRSQW